MARRLLNFLLGLLASGLFASAAPEVRAAPQQEAAAQSAIRLRVGRHPDFWRLVFEGPDAAAIAFTAPRPGVSELQAAHPFLLDVARLPARVDALESVQRVSPRRLVLAHPQADAKILRLPPNRFVLDLYPGAEGRPQPAADPGPATERTPAAGKPGQAEPRRNKDAAGRDRERAPTAALAAPPPGDGGEAAVRHADTRLRPPMSPAAVPEGSRGTSRPPSAAGEARTAEGGRGEVADAAAMETETAPAPDAPPRLDIAARATPLGPELIFSWNRPVGAAVFRYGDRLWVVFDVRAEKPEIDGASIRAAARGYLRGMRGEPHPEATVVRLDLARPGGAEVRREGMAWILRLRERPRPPLPLPLELDARRRQIVIPETTALFAIRDPVAGETLEVATLSRPAGLAQARRLVDLTLLATAQGAAWLPRADGIRARRSAGRVILARSGGLRLAGPPAPAAAADGREERGAAPPAISHEPPAAEPATPGDGATGADGRPGAAPDATHARADAQPPEMAGAARVQAAAEPDSGRASSPAPPPPPDGRALQDSAPHEAAQIAGQEQQAAPGSLERDSSPAPPRSTEVTAAEDDTSSAASALPPWKSRFGLRELAALDAAARLALLRDLRMRVSRAQAEERRRLRLERARLLLADALGTETLAALASLRGRDGSEPLAGRMRALTSAAAVLAGRAKVARRLLTSEKGEEAALWRLVLEAAARHWEVAGELLDAAHRTLKTYPEPLQIRLAPAVIMTALQNGNAPRAYFWLDRMTRRPLPRRQAETYRFLEALALGRDGREEEAERLLTELQQQADWLVAVKAAYARLQLARDAGRIGAEEALASLEQIRPLWRGHPWEPSMLRSLGEVQAELDRVTAALASWREVLARFPRASEARGLAERMARLLQAALDPARPPRIPAPEAFALYRRYPELAPEGAAAEPLYLALAAALLEAGMTPAVPPLLKERIAPDTTPQRRLRAAELALRAALADGAHDEARRILASLPATGNAARPRPILRLAARLALASGRPRDALALLGDAPAPEELPLWIEAAWEARDYGRLRAAARQLQHADGGSADGLSSWHLLAVAAGLAMLDDEEGFAAFARSIETRMDDPAAPALLSLLRPRPRFGGEMRSVAAQLAAYVREVQGALAGAGGAGAEG